LNAKNFRDIPKTVPRNLNGNRVRRSGNNPKGVPMDRDKFSISVVPEPANRVIAGPQIVPDPSAEWDAKWLRPNVTSMQPPPRPVPMGSVSRPVRVSRTSHAVSPIPAARPKLEAESEPPESDPLTLRFLRWLFPDVNQRRAKRFAMPNLVAYYWTGGAPYSYHVGDISATGLFLLTKERWAPGTLIQMTLQPQDGRVNTADSSICILSEVVRWGENGAGFNFVLSDYENLLSYGIMPGEALDRKSVERFLQKIGVPEVR
jgi:hypothetical protein